MHQSRAPRSLSRSIESRLTRAPSSPLDSHVNRDRCVARIAPPSFDFACSPSPCRVVAKMPIRRSRPDARRRAEDDTSARSRAKSRLLRGRIATACFSIKRKSVFRKCRLFVPAKAVSGTQRDKDRASFPRLSSDFFPPLRAIHSGTGPIDLSSWIRPLPFLPLSINKEIQLDHSPLLLWTRRDRRFFIRTSFPPWKNWISATT